MEIATAEQARRIRELNDAFRKTFAGGKMVMSASVAALPEMVSASALLKVAEFTDFTPENDPHGEHDFLSFEYCNRRFFWKCDYYDKEMDGGSEDPADPDKTTRVGTRRTFGADGKGGWLVDPYSGPGLQVKTCRPSSMRARSTAATKCPLRRRAVRTGANWNAGGGSIALLLSQTQNIRDEFL
jgi:hypothetical protein